MSLTKQLISLWTDLRGAYRLAADPHSYLRLSVDFIFFRILRLTSIPLMNRERQVWLKDGVNLTYRLNRSDIYTIHEVWINGEYRLPLDIQPSLIVDLGANIGLTSLWLATRYGCSYLIAAEPVAANASIARKNLLLNGIAGEVLEVAAGPEDGSVTFDEGPGATNGRIVETSGALNPGSHQYRYVVPMVSINTVLRSLPPDTQIDLLKIDIEGGEGALLSGDVSWLRRVNAIIAEFHPALADCKAMIHCLKSAGFDHVHTGETESSGGNTMNVFLRFPQFAESGAVRY